MLRVPDSIYILGAGFTKAVFPSAPLNNDLLGAIAKEGGETLRKYKGMYDMNDIEKMLTQLDLDATEDSEKRKDRTKINAEISSYFSKYRFSKVNSKVPNWVEIFASKILKQNDSIISLNYDCFLEGALDKYGVWTPNGGYARIKNPLADSIPANPNNILIYKIHGSENFVESSVIGKNRNQTAVGFSIDPSVYPRSGAHTYFGGGALNPRPYIIAPSFVKIPHVDIAAMMLDILNIAENVRNLIVIGCGIRPEDNFLWLLLIRFLNKVVPPRKRLIILSPSSDDTWRRISNYWVGDICRFADAVIIPCGIENGIETLDATINSKADQKGPKIALTH